MREGYGINNQIDADRINLILADGTMNEKISLTEAIKIAEEEGLDLVEVSNDNKGTSICKILDYGKLMYERGKKQKKNKKNNSHLKEIKYGYNIDIHDLKVKHDKILKFLEKKYTVRYVLELKGREKSLIEEAKLKMMNNLEDFRGVAQWKDPLISKGESKILISTTLQQI